MSAPSVGQPVDHLDEVLDAVLAVGVERREHRCARLPAGVFHARLDRRTLTEVDGMGDHMGAGAQGSVARLVSAAVVHTDHVVENGANVRDDVADDVASL